MRLKLPVSVQQATGIIISFLASVHPNQASKEQIGSPQSIKSHCHRTQTTPNTKAMYTELAATEHTSTNKSVFNQ
jgi:hypothetical protein